MKLDLNLLVALDALLTEGSVTRAAAKLHLSTPAMSHTLARIRDALGDPMFVRSGRTLVPTPRAQAIRDAVRDIVDQAKVVMSHGHGTDLAQVARNFVVRAPEGIPVVFGATLAVALHAAMPRSALRFIAEGDNDPTALREGRIDLDIGSIQEHGPEIQTEALFDQRLVGAVREDHHLVQSRVTLKRFASALHVAIGQRGTYQGPLDDALQSAGHRRFVLLTVPSAYGCLMAAARSELVATVPARLAQNMHSSLGLRIFELPVELPPEQIVQAWHRRFDADAPHHWLRASVKRLLTAKQWNRQAQDG